MAHPTKLRVLLVDDDPDWRACLRGIVEDLGHSPFEANDGLEAVARLSEERFDLVLLDLYMPGMDGAEVLRQLEAPLPRIVFLTSAEASLVGPLREGPYYYLPKDAGLAEFSLLLASFAAD